MLQELESRSCLSQTTCSVNGGEYDFCLSVFQTFVNDLRIPEQTYVTLKLSDVIRFGYDILSLLFPFCLKQFTQSKFAPAAAAALALCSTSGWIGVGRLGSF